jgi:hypothetical protein
MSPLCRITLRLQAYARLRGLFCLRIKARYRTSGTFNSGVITTNNSSDHKWIEYHTKKNRYIIDPTWCDWDFVREPKGIYAGNAAFAEACRTSYNKEKLIEAKAKSWFFRHVSTVTRDSDKRAHGL